MLKPKIRVILILVWLFSFPLSATAQGGPEAVIYPPQFEDFPIIHTYLKVFGDDGSFLYGLLPDAVSIFEDAKRIGITDLNELETGVQFVVAINLGPAFAIRDQQA